FAARLDALRQVRQALRQAVAGAREMMQRVDLLRFQAEEIRGAHLRAGEEDDLVSERSRLLNADRILTDAATVYASLVGGDETDYGEGALTFVRKGAQTLANIAGVDSSARALQQRLEEVVYLMEDIGAEIRAYRDAVEADPARLLAVEERLAELRTLKRKY